MISDERKIKIEVESCDITRGVENPVPHRIYKRSLLYIILLGIITQVAAGIYFPHFGAPPLVYGAS